MTDTREHVSFWRSFGVTLLCWAAIGIFQGYGMFSGDRDDANYLPYAHYFVWAGGDALSWALIVPFIFLFARHYTFHKDHWVLRTLQYTLLTAVVILGRPWMRGLGWFYKPDQHASFLSTVAHLRQQDMPMSILICLMVFGLCEYQNAKREARWRELREAELESRVNVAELQMLRMQLHPHFLFNALQAATVLIHEDPIAAENVLHRLSELLRVALDDMRSLQVPLQQEILFLEHYVEIQKQRFQQRLTVRYDIDANALSVSVPTLLLQPLVENAIHHGIGKHKGDDVVEVSAQRRGQQLLLEVRNFASSLLLEDVSNTGHGVGLKNTRARLEQMYGDQATLELTSLQPRGVSTLVTLPVEGVE
jgi:two-component system LytT family sensor kinase